MKPAPPDLTPKSRAFLLSLHAYMWCWLGGLYRDPTSPEDWSFLLPLLFPILPYGLGFSLLGLDSVYPWIRRRWRNPPQGDRPLVEGLVWLGSVLRQAGDQILIFEILVSGLLSALYGIAQLCASIP